MDIKDEQRTMLQDENSVIKKTGDLNGVEKAAVLLISLGVNKASKILKQLRDTEVESITRAISDLKNVSSEVVNSVQEEYHKLLSEKKFLVEGGNDVAKDFLVEARGREQADEMLRKLGARNGGDAFNIIQNTDVKSVINFMKSEHPQIAAVILAHLKIHKAAEILSKLPNEFRVDVALRMAKLGEISSEVIDELSAVIEDQLIDYADFSKISKGSGAVAGILNETDMSTERQVLESIENVDPELAKEIKDQMFLFDDILELEDRTMQDIVAKINTQDLMMALKGVELEMKEKFVSNMSTRAREILEEDLEASGPAHIKQVEEARQNILRTIKKLEQEGKISIRKKDEEMFIE